MLNRLLPLLVYLVLVLVDVPGHGLSIAQNRVGNFFESRATAPPENSTQAVQPHRENGPAYGETASGMCQWYLTDRLGSVTGITDANGNLINATTYDSYGHILTQSNPAVADQLAFTGREFDAETGLYYFRARYYNADLGRFQSEDPEGFIAGDHNVYRYALNNILNLTDPTGRDLAEYGALLRNSVNRARKVYADIAVNLLSLYVVYAQLDLYYLPPKFQS